MSTAAGDFSISFSFWMWIATFFVQTVVFSVAGTWWVGRLVSTIRDQVRLERKEIDQALALVESDLRREMESNLNGARQSIESLSRLYAKDMADLTQRWYELSIHVRDTYTPMKNFEKVTDEIKILLKEGLDRLEDRMGDKR